MGDPVHAHKSLQKGVEGMEFALAVLQREKPCWELGLCRENAILPAELGARGQLCQLPCLQNEGVMIAAFNVNSHLPHAPVLGFN